MKKILALGIIFVVVASSGGIPFSSCENENGHKSYIRVIDGNPMLFVGDGQPEILGLRTTSDPYVGEEKYQNVIEYVDMAAKYNYTHVTVKFSWYLMDENELDAFPDPNDIGMLMNWTILDDVFDYALSKEVYIVPFFWHTVPPQWWFDLTPNYEDFLQTSEKDEIAAMMSFNVPDFQKYEDEAIKAVIERFKNHPAYLGFLLQFGYTNEDNYPGAPYIEGWYDYSPFAKQRFREWLREEYNNNVSSLRIAWDDPSVNFEDVEPPEPLPDITSLDEISNWVNNGGDTRRQFYDWQLFRLEEKKRARDRLIYTVKDTDSDHVLIMTSPGFGGCLLFTNSMALDYEDYSFSPKVDILHFNPGIHKTWDIYKEAGAYVFVKYVETRGKTVFIKWESRSNLPPDNVEELKKRARFARETGSGIALWENKIQDFPEFTDEQIKAVADTFLSTPEGKLEMSKFAILDDTFSNSFGYRKGNENLLAYSHFKSADRCLLAGTIYSAGLDFDVLTTGEILNDSSILGNFSAIALSNLYRMDDELLEILINYKNSGGGLFIQGRTGLYDKYGERETKYLKQLLGLNSIQEYEIIPYSWTYSAIGNPLLKKITGKQGDMKSNYNVLYIPTFDYQNEGYTVLGRLDQNPNVATVGYKENVVFWFPRLGMQIVDMEKEDLETTKQFLRNLYEFFGVSNTTVNIVKPKENHLYIFDREIMSTIFGSTIVIGEINVEVDAYEDGIDRVEFYIDDVLKSTDMQAPFEWLWNEKAIGRHEMKVVTYDNVGNTATDEINVILFNLGG